MGRVPHPTSDGPAPLGLGATIPRGRSLGSDHRLGRTLRPPGRWTRAVWGLLPPVGAP